MMAITMLFADDSFLDWESLYQLLCGSCAYLKEGIGPPSSLEAYGCRCSRAKGQRRNDFTCLSQMTS
ncbi:hypothetical protein [Marinomonas sp. THO17]|uniref:hypothetical protein n=1 Tax=Marinomonas sp. THO17 TaxID=3149048 RepID=UPI00336BEC2B